MTGQTGQTDQIDVVDEILEDKKASDAMPETVVEKRLEKVEEKVVEKVVESSLPKISSATDLFASGTQKFNPGVGVDIGTSNIVVSRCTKDGTFVSRYHRNMLYPLDVSDESSDLLERGDYLYVKVDDVYYIVGEDALKLVNAIGKGEVVRPMKDGILNPSLRESTELLFYIIKAVVGDSIIPNESLRFSLPANPVDEDLDNLFHKMTLQSFFTKMGYAAKAVNEAMCICYDCNPIMVAENDDTGNEEKILLSGISCSCGGGMTNVALSFKGIELVSFSITKSGDYIDKCASKVTGTSLARIIRKKERKLDLSKTDATDRDLVALGVYYDEFLDRISYSVSRYFKDHKNDMDGKLEVVVAGGSSMPIGFCDKLRTCIQSSRWPFNIYRVRHSETPFYAVCNGACIRAQSDQQSCNH